MFAGLTVLSDNKKIRIDPDHPPYPRSKSKLTMNPISFMSANFVARQLNYQLSGGVANWMDGDRATQEYFRPIETYAERFDALLTEVVALGFGAIDIWLAHLHPQWATPDHIAIAKVLLEKHELSVPSLAGGFGTTMAEFSMSCRIANELGATVLGGGTALLPKERAAVIEILREHGMRLGIENHPEKTPQELLRKIGDDAPDVIGACVDTGWFGTQGYDAADALDELGEAVFYVHLKDVSKMGGHETCRLGEGVVPIQECVMILQKLGYTGALSIEHEPFDFDPREDCRLGLARLQKWLEP